jgi:hypothetical protein
MEEISKTYSQFLNQLLVSKCMYKGDKDKDDRVLQRQEVVFKMKEHMEVPSEQSLRCYIEYMDDLYMLIRSKKVSMVLTHPEFSQNLFKVMEKKNKRCGNVFFLNLSLRERSSINVGMIARNLTKTGSACIRDFLYMMYTQAVSILHPHLEGCTGTTHEFYRGILGVFDRGVQNDDPAGSLKDDLKDLLSDVLPEAGIDQSLQKLMNDKELNSMLDGIIKSVVPQDKIDELRDEIKNTDRTYLKDTVKGIKDKLANMDLDKLFNAMQSSGNTFPDVAETLKMFESGNGLPDMTEALKSMNIDGLEDMIKNSFSTDS